MWCIGGGTRLWLFMAMSLPQRAPARVLVSGREPRTTGCALSWCHNGCNSAMVVRESSGGSRLNSQGNSAILVPP